MAGGIIFQGFLGILSLACQYQEMRTIFCRAGLDMPGRMSHERAFRESHVQRLEGHCWLAVCSFLYVMLYSSSFQTLQTRGVKASCCLPGFGPSFVLVVPGHGDEVVSDDLNIGVRFGFEYPATCGLWSRSHSIHKDFQFSTNFPNIFQKKIPPASSSTNSPSFTISYVRFAVGLFQNFKDRDQLYKGPQFEELKALAFDTLS